METSTGKRKVRIGVLGGFRGMTMIGWCVRNPDRAEVVAICDFSEHAQKSVKEFLEKERYNATLYRDFEQFLCHDMDAVVLANYANEHAPYAIRCLEKGLHVFSEVLPVQTLDEAVRLAEAVEKSGKQYFYAENYCYFPVAAEMKRLYRQGALGEVEYAEGEYVHNCAEGWQFITYGNPAHWRNTMSAFYYCTHSIGPLLHITGLRPVKVTGFELPRNAMSDAIGAKGGSGAIEMVTLENGAVVKSFHGLTLRRNSVWYCLYGTKGRAESEREAAGGFGTAKLFLQKDTAEHPGGEWARYRPRIAGGEPIDGEFGVEGEFSSRVLKEDPAKREEDLGHGGSDHYTMDNFIKAVCGEPADVIGIYEALDMAFVGLFGYFSALEGGKSVEIPDFRDPAVRERFRGDRRCTDPKVAGEQLLPTCTAGTPDVPQEVYARMKKLYEESVNAK